MNAIARSTHYRACHLCEAICGLVIQTEGEEIVSIKGDPNDPLSRGHICPKAIALKDIHEDPDRLRRPVKRVMDAQGEANMRAKVDGMEYSGHGLSTDIVAACAEALLEIVNRAIRNADQVSQPEVA